MTKTIVTLVLRMARENPTWGYTRLEGALKNLGLRICPTSVRNILKRHGIEPAPDRRRKTSWRTFLKAHWESIAAADFFTIEVWTLGGLVTYYTVFVIELSTRQVHIGGSTPNPDTAFMKQVARTWTDHFDGFLLGKRFLIRDRDGKWVEGFTDMLENEGVDTVLCPPRAPNCNAYAERFIRSLKEECLDRMIFFGEESFRRALRNFVEHYHLERNHQGVGNELLVVSEVDEPSDGTVRRKERLGGLLNFYHRQAA